MSEFLRAVLPEPFLILKHLQFFIIIILNSSQNLPSWPKIISLVLNIDFEPPLIQAL